jgi:hypothetical protein
MHHPVVKRERNSLMILTATTRYDRAHTKGCLDLRWAGPNSEVRIIRKGVKHDNRN